MIAHVFFVLYSTLVVAGARAIIVYPALNLHPCSCCSFGTVALGGDNNDGGRGGKEKVWRCQGPA